MPTQKSPAKPTEWERVKAYFDSKGQKTGLLQSNQGMEDESVMDPINAGNAEGKYRQHEYMMVKDQLLRFEIPTEGERPNTFDAYAQDGTKYTITVEKVDRADLNTDLSKAMRAQFTTFKDEVKADFNTAEMIFSFSTPFAVESQNSVGGKSYEYFKIQRNVPVADDVRLPSEVAISAARAPLPPHKNEGFLKKLDEQLKLNQLELDKKMAELESIRKKREERPPVRESEKSAIDEHPTRKNTHQQSLAEELSPKQIAALAPDTLSSDISKQIEDRNADEVEISDELPSEPHAFAPQRRSSNISEQGENRGISEKAGKLTFFQRIRIAINNVISRVFPSPNEREFNTFISKLESQAAKMRANANSKLENKNLSDNDRSKYIIEAKIKWYFEVEDLTTLKNFRQNANQLKPNDRFKNRIESMFEEVQNNKYLIEEFNRLDMSASFKNESQRRDSAKSVRDSRKSLLVNYSPLHSQSELNQASSERRSELKSEELPSTKDHSRPSRKGRS